ncbi:MAG TPA: glycosyltransferase [Xanthobacteraceae bacterium]|nr:glycosyltransferase [Xanthobacteraceae bacterium]
MIDALLKKSLVVIPSLNGAASLERALATFRVPAEMVLVVDQGSTDNTGAICAAAGVAVLQLGGACTFAQACNRGAEIARARGCDFVFVGRNDVTFRTDVVRELLRAMLDDPDLAIAAPSLIVEGAGQERVTYRAQWDLARLEFGHDFAAPEAAVERTESDFCELAFAAIRMSAIDKAGLLDDDFSFHEDAEFCLRLREAGYSCAYLPQSQIARDRGSAFERDKPSVQAAQRAQARSLFAAKHLKHSVHYADRGNCDPGYRETVRRHLPRYLKKFGLLDRSRPELIFSAPGGDPFDYLYTVLETPDPPREWLLFRDSYKAVFAASQWNVDVLKGAGFRNVFYAPLGVETDTFHPWGPVCRPYQEKTYLWVGRNQLRRGLDVVLDAWRHFHRERPDARLVLLGTDIRSGIRSAPARVRRSGDFAISDYEEARITVYETMSALDDAALAAIYRSADFTVCSSRAEGFGLTVAESMACGTPAIFPSYGATGQFSFEGALLLDATRAAPARGSCAEPGDGWEPDVDRLVGLLRQAYDLDDQGYRANARAGTRIIRSRYTWRSTVMALRDGLSATERGSPATTSDTAGRDRSAAPVQPAHQPRPRFIARTFRRAGHLVYRVAEEWEKAGPRAGASEFLASTGIGRRAARAWRSVSNHVASALGSNAVRHLGRAVEHQPGVLFVGYAEASLGLGESFRGLLVAAATQPLDFKIYPFRVGVETRMIGPFMPERYDLRHSFDINVIEVAADQVPVVAVALGERRYRGSYNVLRTYWELPAAPPEWKPMLDGIDEIWAPNEYVRNAFRNIFAGPISVIPPHVTLREKRQAFDRSAFNLEADRFYFIFSFDYYSSAIRKNPLGTIRAFRDAFPSEIDRVGLVIKSVGFDQEHAYIRNTIRKYAEIDPRIVLIERTMTRDEFEGLMQACDCFLSLHRAEGFGLGMAEAMLLGKAVVGTQFSGNVDFLNDETGFPVSFKLRRVEPHEYAWAHEQSWAEPDHDEAVAAIRSVRHDTQLRARKVQAGQAFIRAHYGAEPVGLAVKARLDAIRAAQAQRRKDAS